MEARTLAAGKKNAARLRAYLVFIDESGFLLVPPVQRTWAPVGHTPVLRHRYRRDKLSAISAITVSPVRKRLGLYHQLHTHNIRQDDVAAFLRHLLRHVRHRVIVLWDNASQHRGSPIRTLCRTHRRLRLEAFPPYAPELNPDEGVWRHAKRCVANGNPDDLDELLTSVLTGLRTLRGSQSLLKACIRKADLQPSPA